MTDLRQRLAAILAADAVGYSRLMSLDERATVAALDMARSVFSEQTLSHQGRVVDTAGDSILAIFETAAGALNAAMQVQARLAQTDADMPAEKRMQFRIGIHSGDVMEKADGSVYGDGVNIAARLQALAEPGQITVSDAIHGAVRGKVSATFVDQGEQQVKNIAHPVRAYRVQADGKAELVPAAAAKPVAGEIDLSLPDKPSIAVLPFTNMSGDPEQEYFTDGITEDIITELSRFHSLFVIARNSSFTYKGKSVDVRTVSKELGVRYVLEGSIRRRGSRIRVTAQLIDALTGNHIWAEKYDRVLQDIFVVQEELTECIVAAIGPQVETSEADRARRVHPTNMTAYEIALRARSSAFAGLAEADPVMRDRGLVLAREALAIDPRCGLALRALALSQWMHVYFHTAASPAEAIGEAIHAATSAIALDPGDHIAHWLKGLMLYFSGQMDLALSNLRRACELNPNDARALGALGYCEAMGDNPRLGLEYAMRALRLSPRDPMIYITLNTLGWAYFAAKEYSEAMDCAQRGAVVAPRFPPARLCLAVSRVGLGQFALARAEFEVWNSLIPGEVADGLSGRWATVSSPVIARRMTTFLRIAAGVEDPTAADALR